MRFCCHFSFTIALSLIWIVVWIRCFSWSMICSRYRPNPFRIQFTKNHQHQICRSVWSKPIPLNEQIASCPAKIWSKLVIWSDDLWPLPMIFDNSKKVSAKIEKGSGYDGIVCDVPCPLKMVSVIMSDRLGVYRNRQHSTVVSIGKVYRSISRWVVKIQEFGKIQMTAIHRYNRLIRTFIMEAEIMRAILVWILDYRADRHKVICREAHEKRNAVSWANSRVLRKAANTMTPMDR